MYKGRIKTSAGPNTDLSPANQLTLTAFWHFFPSHCRNASVAASAQILQSFSYIQHKNFPRPPFAPPLPREKTERPDAASASLMRR